MDGATRVEQLAGLETLGGGAALEKFADELTRVLENIRDPNTEPEAKRKVVLEVTFAPDADREVVKVIIAARSTLAGTKPHGDVMFVGRRDGHIVGTVLHGPGPQEDPRQGVLAIDRKAEPNA